MNISTEALSAIAELQIAGGAGSFIDAKAAAELAHHKYVDLGNQRPDGKQAARLTVVGISWAADHAEEIDTAHASHTAKPTPKPYETIAGIPIPPVQRVPRTYKKAAIYPLETMAIGESFHVPVTEKRPEPWRTFAGTMYSAQTRLRKRGGDHTFVIRKVMAETDPTGLEGARVWRVPPPTSAGADPAEPETELADAQSQEAAE